MIRTFGHTKVIKESFLVFLRAKPCLRCGKPGPSEAHHLIGRGANSCHRNDWCSIPLCPRCHSMIDLVPMELWMQPWRKPYTGLAEDLAGLIVEFLTGATEALDF